MMPDQSTADPRLIQRCRHAPRWAAEENERLRHALAFYADDCRYQGPNQPLVEEYTDPYQPQDLGYLLDVTRDHGDIARKALAS